MQQAQTIVEGKKIEDVITRFYHKDGELHYQLLIKIKGGTTITFKEFKDYSLYKKALSILVKAKKERSTIKIDSVRKSISSQAS